MLLFRGKTNSVYNYKVGINETISGVIRNLFGGIIRFSKICTGAYYLRPTAPFKAAKLRPSINKS